MDWRNDTILNSEILNDPYLMTHNDDIHVWHFITFLHLRDMLQVKRITQHCGISENTIQGAMHNTRKTRQAENNTRVIWKHSWRAMGKTTTNMHGSEMCRTSWTSRWFHYLSYRPWVYEILLQMFRELPFGLCLHKLTTTHIKSRPEMQCNEINLQSIRTLLKNHSASPNKAPVSFLIQWRHY